MSQSARVLCSMVEPNTWRYHAGLLAGLLSPAGRINTPSQGTWCLSSRELSFGIRLMRVQGTYLLMMFWWMVLGDVITKVFGSGVPVNTCMFVADLIDDPKIAHFHRAGSLPFNSIVCDADCCGVIAMDWRGRLGMAHLFEDEADDFDFLDVEEQGTEFGFCCGSRNVFEYGAQ